MTGTVTQTTHGQYRHATPHQVGRGYMRHDEWISNRGETAFEHVHVAHSEDDSPIYLGPYSAACASCWLNHCHTEELHNRRTA